MYINNVNKFLNYLFYISILFLILISVIPGSLIGYLLYGDWGLQPILIKNPYGSAINHFIYYLYLSLLGLFYYLKHGKFKKIIYGLFFLSIILELLHIIIPNRSFQISDLFANVLGVIVAYLIIKIYLLFRKT